MLEARSCYESEFSCNAPTQEGPVMVPLDEVIDFLMGYAKMYELKSDECWQQKLRCEKRYTETGKERFLEMAKIHEKDSDYLEGRYDALYHVAIEARYKWRD